MAIKKRKYCKSLVNQRFGKLLVLNDYKIITRILPCGKKIAYRMWLCQCDCGNIKYVRTAYLTYRDVKSCGCYTSKRLDSGVAAYNKLYLHYVKSAEKRGLCFTLTKEQFSIITKQNCHYCDTQPSQICKPGKGCSTGNYIYNGIDRINNDKGYIIDNIVPCCETCNRMKLKMSYKDFLCHIRKIYKNKENIDE